MYKKKEIFWEYPDHISKSMPLPGTIIVRKLSVFNTGEYEMGQLIVFFDNVSSFNTDGVLKATRMHNYRTNNAVLLSSDYENGIVLFPKAEEIIDNTVIAARIERLNNGGRSAVISLIKGTVDDLAKYYKICTNQKNLYQ